MSLVTIERHGDVALVTIDNPPVNALTRGLRAGLLEALEEIAADARVTCAVIRCAGRTFIAGADIRELDRAIRPPHTPAVVARIEASPKPIVAALHGNALGGGLELALACHARIATPEATLGFPEVRLGLIPGASGTQRLPRLIDVAVALDLMLSGEPVAAARALELGIVDAVVEAPGLLAAASAKARALAAHGAPLPRIRDLAAPEVPAALLAARRERLAARPYGRLAPESILRSVANAAALPFDAAVAAERELFVACLGSAESKALRYAFFAEREAARRDPSTAAAVPLARAAVVGAGTMGTGIAFGLLRAGLDVVLSDVGAEQLEKGRAVIAKLAAVAVEKGRLSAADGEALMARLDTATGLAAVADADVVIEAVYENLKLKRAVFAELDAACAERTLLASNTSTLDIDALAAATRRPAQVLGLHFFSPAHVMRLVEIVRGTSTSPANIATAAALVKRLGKIGVVVGNGFGFVGNRMYHSYSREAQQLLLEGAVPQQIDAALEEWGMAMGPLAVADLAGLDVGYRIRRERGKQGGDPAYFRVADVLAQIGRYGQKTGSGHYRYAPGSRVPLPDPEVAEIIARESTSLGVVRRVIEAPEIVERCILATIVEGIRVLEAGIARSAADIDVIWLNGYGFPRFRGGPMHYADTIGLGEVRARIEAYRERLGPRYWQTPQLLEELASCELGVGAWSAS